MSVGMFTPRADTQLFCLQKSSRWKKFMWQGAVFFKKPHLKNFSLILSSTLSSFFLANNGLLNCVSNFCTLKKLNYYWCCDLFLSFGLNDEKHCWYPEVALFFYRKIGQRWQCGWKTMEFLVSDLTKSKRRWSSSIAQRQCGKGTKSFFLRWWSFSCVWILWVTQASQVHIKNVTIGKCVQKKNVPEAKNVCQNDEPKLYPFYECGPHLRAHVL